MKQTDQRGCPICKCQRCRPLHDCHKKCALGLVHDSRGCPTCQCRSPFNPETTSASATASHRCTSSNDGNVSYAYGERWQVDDCTSCICHHGGPTCTEMICPLPCHNAIFIPVNTFKDTFVQIALTFVIFNEFKVIVYHSIALFELYLASFE